MSNYYYYLRPQDKMKPQNPGTSENERQEDVDLYVAAEEEGATGGTPPTPVTN